MFFLSKSKESNLNWRCNFHSFRVCNMLECFSQNNLITKELLEQFSSCKEFPRANNKDGSIGSLTAWGSSTDGKAADCGVGGSVFKSLWGMIFSTNGFIFLFKDNHWAIRLALRKKFWAHVSIGLFFYFWTNIPVEFIFQNFRPLNCQTRC